MGKGKAFPHALVAGVERTPLKVTKRMSKKRIERRSTLKPFAKIVNYNHILPTRFQESSLWEEKSLRVLSPKTRLPTRKPERHLRTRSRSSSLTDTTSQITATTSKQLLTSSSRNLDSEHKIDHILWSYV